MARHRQSLLELETPHRQLDVSWCFMRNRIAWLACNILPHRSTGIFTAFIYSGFHVLFHDPYITLYKIVVSLLFSILPYYPNFQYAPAVTNLIIRPEIRLKSENFKATQPDGHLLLLQQLLPLTCHFGC